MDWFLWISSSERLHLEKSVLLCCTSFDINLLNKRWHLPNEITSTNITKQPPLPKISDSGAQRPTENTCFTVFMGTFLWHKLVPVKRPDSLSAQQHFFWSHSWSFGFQAEERREKEEDVHRARASDGLTCHGEGVVKVPSESRDPRRDVVSELKIKVCPGSVVFSLLWIMRRCHKKQPVLIIVFIQFVVCYQ